MHSKSNIDLLLLKEVKTKKIIETEKNIEIYIEAKRKLKKCEYCKSKNIKIHDYRTQIIKDIPLYGKKTILILKRTRYKCKCCNKNINQNFDFISKKCQMTNRLKRAICNEFSKMKTIKLIAQEYFVSRFSVSKILSRLNVIPEKLSEVLCIDEFKGDSGTEKYQTILGDCENKKVSDILKSRKLNDLKEYFKVKKKGRIIKCQNICK